MFPMTGQARAFPVFIPKQCQNGNLLANWLELTTHARGGTRKKLSVFAGSEFGWIRLA